MDDSSLEAFLTNPANVWLASAVLLLLVEAFGLPGVGLLFAGLGALGVGLAIHGHAIAAENYTLQLIVFFVTSTVCAAALWKPMQKFRVGKHQGQYHNIIGSTAYVGSNGITRKHGGEVTWSGTIMRAELSRNTGVEALEAGSQVVIVGLTGATLVVQPKD
jgi:membrane protein implicated in regulation of membrane protease activity